MDDLESAEFFAGMAELTEDRPVEFQLVDLACDVPRTRSISVGIGVGCEDVLVRPWRNTNGPADAEVVVHVFGLRLLSRTWYRIVGAVGDPDVTLPIDLKPVRQVELAGSFARLFAARLRQEPAVLVELHDAVIAVAIGNEDVALRIPSDIRRAAENIFLCRRVRSVGRRDCAFDCRRPAAEHHQKFALRAELRDGVRAFVDRPDIVLRIDADGVREFKTVIALADFLDEIAVLIELPKARVRAAVIDEDVALGICRDSRRLRREYSPGGSFRKFGTDV